jgi:TolB-like protein/tetratricopeptide (TPR) repeat protein
VSDVFISYAHATEAQAQRIEAALRGLGYSVWRDDQLPAHRAFREVLDERLAACKAVVVVWSADALKSDYVHSEAERARADHKLVQLRIDGARLPLPFDSIQCADLTGWDGDLAAPGWRKVADSVEALVGGPGRAMTAQAEQVAPAAPAERRLAVLAFDNLSGDPEMAYFSDGVSEEIQQTVARGADLKVIGRTSSFQFRGADKAVRKVVADLKATHILDGSVRRSGARVRISAQLIECSGETTLWSDRYDRDLTDIFALQDEIAASVAAELKTVLARSPTPARIDPDVFDLFLRARDISASDFEARLRRLRMFEEVVTGAPSFARGWAALAGWRANLLRHDHEDALAAGVTREQATLAAETALRLDPHMGLAYQALADLEPWAAYRAREALNEKALAAAPNDAAVLANAAEFCSRVGRVQEGMAIARQAYELDPLAPAVANELASQFLLSGQIAESGRVLDAAQARWPENEVLAGNAMGSAARRGDRARVERLAEAWSAAAASKPTLQDAISYARNMLEPDPEWIRKYLAKQQEALARSGTVPLFGPFRLYHLGLTEEAYALLDEASFDHLFDPDGPSPSRLFRTGAIFARLDKALFRDARFPQLCAKLGLADYWVETDKWPDCADEVPYDFRAQARRLAGVHRPAT